MILPSSENDTLLQVYSRCMLAEGQGVLFRAAWLNTLNGACDLAQSIADRAQRAEAFTAIKASLEKLELEYSALPHMQKACA